MMHTSLHCQFGVRYDVNVEWVRKHGNQPAGGQDYFNVTVSANGNDVTLFMSPEQLDALTTKLAQAGLDRQTVIEEEANSSQDAESGGGG